uniref:NADH-ubiquinone oxidoreductase chain 4L n=1 Tax=Siphonaria gigas TaxID=1087063 RepID=G8HSF3_9GAST|nr:NADH dehydrogenase subunit 4L [Siphonaria gigas]AEQ93909.1 NADH dehydrogenase subunit 4L [Siphonaria gigas]
MVMYISMFSFFSCALAFFVYQEQALSLLIALEGIMLSLLVFTYYVSVTVLGGSSPAFLVLLTYAACEAALGLSLLVSILRLRGNDLVKSFSSVNFFA